MMSIGARGEIVVRGKGGRFDRLPVPVDVGRALGLYLRCRRPGRAIARDVLEGAGSPAGPLNSEGVKGGAAGVPARPGLESVGPHRLRHTAATVMLREGGSLPEIAQVLRHQRAEDDSSIRQGRPRPAQSVGAAVAVVGAA